jgi:surface antigen
MKKIFVVFVLVAFLGTQLAGCASMSGTEKGAIGGAAAGGLLGALIGDTKGAIIGTIAGAVVGAVIGNYYDKQVASRAEAAKKYEYIPQKSEEKLEIESSSLTSQDVTVGSTVESNIQYTVLAPVETQKMKVTETRTLVNGNERTDLAKREVIRDQGTHISTMKFTMPKDIEKGDYTLITTVSDGKQTKTVKNPIRVL